MSLSRAERARLLRIAKGRSDEPLRLLEGPKAVREALALGVVRELWIRRDLDSNEAAALRDAADHADCTVGEAAPAELDRLAGTVSPQGVLALVVDTARTLPEVADRSGLLLWLDGVQDPGNVGAVVRVAVAFGVEGLLLSEGTADPLGLKALRASTGLALRAAFARDTAARIAAALAERGRPVWALDRDGDDVFGLDAVPDDLVLAVGSEGRGIGEVTRRAAVRAVGIPLAAGVDSLNAAVAVGIAVAQLVRRRP